MKDQKPLVLPEGATVKRACAAMASRGAGSVLIVDAGGRLIGIFTGRDAVKFLGRGDASPDAPVSAFMSASPVSVSPDARAVDALRIMEHGGFRHVPVIEQGAIWGVVSRGDFKGMEFEGLCWCSNRERSKANRGLIEVVEGRKPLILSTDDAVADACSRMTEDHSRSVLVLDKRRRLVGIFTGRDAVRMIATRKKPGLQLLAKAMTRKPATIAPDCHAIDALRLMTEGGFRHLPVVGDGGLLGVVSKADFTGCEVDRLEEEEHLFECLR